MEKAVEIVSEFGAVSAGRPRKSGAIRYRRPDRVIWPPRVEAPLKNLRIFATLVNGEQIELSDCPTGRDLIRAVLPGGPSTPKALVIEATDKEGGVVRIVVSADESETAKVSVTRES